MRIYNRQTMFAWLISHLLCAALLGGWIGIAQAQDGATCAPPISTCDGDAVTPNDTVPCPRGYQCTCVPSCPSCRDCAVRVCVPAEESECRTACDCDPGLGCFDGKCIAGFAPVFCCEGEQCPAGDQCQHRDGRMDRCEKRCVEQAWLCNDDPDASDRGCGANRVCSCTASCPTCEDCGPNVCLPPGLPTPYECNDDGGCAQAGDRCTCISSCPECDDCALSVCLPSCDDPMCEKRLRASTRKIDRVIEKTRACRADDECVRIDTSTDCQGSCGAWINKSYAPRVESFIDHVDKRYCDGYREDGCPYATPRCVNQRGQCVRGKCTGVAIGTEAPAAR